LHRLPIADVATLVTDRYRLPEAEATRLVTYLHERAGGNAFFTLELLHALEEDGVLHEDLDGWAVGDLASVQVPLLLRQVIDSRLARLGAEAERLLAVAAVIGQTVPLALWESVGETDEDALLDLIERAGEARVVVETTEGEGVRFLHALTRQALYEGIPVIRRRRLHRQIGEALATEPDAHPDAVAYHFRAAGDDRAAGWMVKAGDRAVTSYAYATAEARFVQALPRLAGAERATVLLSLSSLHQLDAGGIREAEEAVRVATEAGDTALAALARMRLGTSLAYVGQIGRGIAELAAGSAVLDALPADALTRVARLRGATGLRSPEARRTALMSAFTMGGWNAMAMATLGCTIDEALDRLDTLPTAARFSLGYVCSALGRGREARAALTSGRAFLSAREQWTYVAVFCAHLLYEAHLPYFADDPTERASLVNAMDETLARHAAQGGAPPPTQALWPLLVLEGRWAEARGRWATSSESMAFRVSAAPHIGRLVRAQGERDEAWRFVHEALPDGPATAPGETIFMPMTAMQRLAATLALDEGDLPTAHEWLAAHDHWLAWSGAVRGLSEGHTLWAQYHRAAGDRERACEHAQAALAHATAPRQPLALLAAHRLLGALDTEAGQFADAETHLQPSLALADACAAPYERAVTLLAMAALRVATGERNVTRTLLDEARAICEPLGAKPALAQAEALAAGLTQA
jgi:tetratricopeptide (TPR) repeat protein